MGGQYGGECGGGGGGVGEGYQLNLDCTEEEWLGLGADHIWAHEGVFWCDICTQALDVLYTSFEPRLLYIP